MTIDNNSFVDDLFSAIARQEGEFSVQPDIPKERNNPLDLRYAGQIGAAWYPPGTPLTDIPPMPDEGNAPIAWFDTLEHGIAAGYRQLWADIARGATLAQLIYLWAPPDQNDSAGYLANVSSWTQIAKTQVLLNLLQVPTEAED